MVQTNVLNDQEVVPARSDRRRKTMAVLAGGLVLGVGAAITLAAWNDSEFVAGSFGSGAFDLEGSIDGIDFVHELEGPLTLDFDADLLSPGAVVSVPFSVQLSDASSYGADVAIKSIGTGAIAGLLRYRVVQTADFDADCSSAASGTELVPNVSAASSSQAAAFSLTSAGAGGRKNLCFVVTAGADLSQSLDGTVTWEFLATSTGPLPIPQP